MFYITKKEIIAQDGEASYYLLPRDIELLAKSEDSRQRLLESLGERGILVSTVTESGVKEIHLDKLLECGTAVHSVL